MSFQTRTFVIEGKNCWAYVPDPVGGKEKTPLLIMPSEAEMSGMVPQILETADQAIQAGKCRSFVLAGFDSDDWNRDFTPWPAPALSKKSDSFAGKADVTMQWMLGPFLMEIESRCPVAQSRTERGILGYSLGRLFALWTFLESKAFGICASCSGSLWYDGWMDYAQTHDIPPDSRIYLSLGRAEEKARNPRMATVGDITRRYAEKLQCDSNVIRSTLVWHEGGHFQDVPGRLADALLRCISFDA